MPRSSRTLSDIFYQFTLSRILAQSFLLSGEIFFVSSGRRRTLISLQKICWRSQFRRKGANKLCKLFWITFFHFTPRPQRGSSQDLSVTSGLNWPMYTRRFPHLTPSTIEKTCSRLRRRQRPRRGSTCRQAKTGFRLLPWPSQQPSWPNQLGHLAQDRF